MPVEAVVTGSSGFVGRALCAALAEAQLSFRRAGRGPDCDIPLDLEDPRPPGLPGGIDVVFHLAGLAHRAEAPAAHARVNHAGTVTLARAAARAGAAHFLFLSSVKALGRAAGPEPRDEDALPGDLDAYGLAKYRAEQDLERLQAETGMRVTVLRPALVYGPGAAGNIERLRRWVQAGRPLPPERGGRSLLSRDDLVRLMLLAVERQGPAFARWHVTDGESYSVRRLCLALAQALPRAPAPTLPAVCWRLGGLARDLASGTRPGSTAELLLGWDRYSAERVRRDTGWAPRLHFEDIAAAITAGSGRC